jgi:hypothetical protein
VGAEPEGPEAAVELAVETSRAEPGSARLGAARR